MGNSNSQIDFEYKVSTKHYKPHRKIKDPLLGEVILMRHDKTGRVALVKERTLNSNSYKTDLETMASHVSLKHAGLTHIHGIAASDTKQPSNVAKPKAYIYFEYLPQTLRQLLDSRKAVPNSKQGGVRTSPEFFSEAELYNILLQLVDVLEYLQQNNLSHGEIRAESCYIGKEGTFKLINKKLIYPDISPFSLARDGDQTVLLTPAALEALKKKKSEPREDKYKVDVFCLGLVLLECATLKSSSQIYDWNNFTMNLTLLSNRLLEIKDRYSIEFYNTIKTMLRIEEEERLDFINLKKILNEGGKKSQVTSFYSFVTEEDTEQTNRMDPPVRARPGYETFGSTNTNSMSTIAEQKPEKGGIFSKDLATKTVRDYNLPKRPGIFNKEPQQFETQEDDGRIPTEPTLRINKVPQPPTVLSTGKINKSKPRNEDFSNYDSVRRQIFAEPRYDENVIQGSNDGNVNRSIRDKFSRLKSNIPNPLTEKNPNRQETRNVGNKIGKLRPFFNHNKNVDISDSYVNIETSERNQEFSQAKDQYEYNNADQNQAQNNFFNVEQLLHEAAEKAQQYTGSPPKSHRGRIPEDRILNNLESTNVQESQLNFKDNQYQNNSISAIGFPFQIPYSRVEDNSKQESFRNLSLHSGYFKGNPELGHSPDISALIHEMDAANVGGQTLMDNVINPYQISKKPELTPQQQRQLLYTFEDLPENKNPLGERNAGAPPMRPKVIGGLKSSHMFNTRENIVSSTPKAFVETTNYSSTSNYNSAPNVPGDDFDAVERAIQRSKETLKLIKNAHVSATTNVHALAHANVNVDDDNDYRGEQEFSHVYSSAPVEGITERIERLLES